MMKSNKNGGKLVTLCLSLKMSSSNAPQKCPVKCAFSSIMIKTTPTV